MHFIYRDQWRGIFTHSRREVKEFKDTASMDEFLKQANNQLDWTEINNPSFQKAGNYVLNGSVWKLIN